MERFGWNLTYTFPFAPPFLELFGVFLRLTLSLRNEGLRVALLRLAVVLLLRAVLSQDLAVVPGSGTVVPWAPTVVPLLISGSTVCSGLAPLLKR